ncbi:MAG TPA: hypothetical protein VG965_03240 [Patescibacteria group bacterium]|nr:hypothetical protein [Patescibacteria group bacterium]
MVAGHEGELPFGAVNVYTGDIPRSSPNRPIGELQPGEEKVLNGGMAPLKDWSNSQIVSTYKTVLGDLQGGLNVGLGPQPDSARLRSQARNAKALEREITKRHIIVSESE